jgi:hypothetical protein
MILRTYPLVMALRGIVSLREVLPGLVGVLVHGLADLERGAVLVRVPVDYVVVLAHGFFWVRL